MKYPNFKNSNSFLTTLMITLFVFLNGNQCNAQYHPFPIDDGTWVNKERTYFLDQNNFPVYSTSWVDKYCANSVDTNINSTLYKQIDFCTTTSSDYHGALRYDNGQVFFVPRDSTNEFLLYDFTLNTSDTAHVIFLNNSGSMPEYSMASVVINNVDTVIVNGIPRRRLDTQGFEWIEGLGCRSGLFMEPWLNVSNYFRELICMSTNDTTHFSNGILEIGVPGSCDLSLSTETLTSNEVRIEIYPNPTSESVFIQSPDNIQITDIFLSNTLGQKISNFTFSKGDLIEIKFADVPGIYFIHIQTSDGEEYIEKILKQ